MDEAATRLLEGLSREDLEGIIEDAALNWLAHDGLWFQAVEGAHGMEEAIGLDGKAWEGFTVIEAKRIMKRMGIGPGGGIPALAEALGRRLYAFINDSEIVEQSEDRLVFRMRSCRVQSTRARKGLPDFPCRPVGLIEYAGFARTIDPRIRTRCVGCPPGPHPPRGLEQGHGHVGPFDGSPEREASASLLFCNKRFRALFRRPRKAGARPPLRCL